MDGIRIAQLVAQAIEGDAFERPVRLDWDDAADDRGRHDRRIPKVRLVLDTGLVLLIGSTSHAKATRRMVVSTPDGHRQDYPHGDHAIARAWSEAQARAILRDIGEKVPGPPRRGRLARLIHSDRRRPTHGPATTHLADVVAQCIGQKPPVRCTETHRAHLPSTGLSEFFGGKPTPATTEHWPSQWHSVGYGLRILRSGVFAGSWVNHDEHMVAHEAWGVLCVPSAPILQALERRRDSSFASALPRGPSMPPASIDLRATALMDLGRRALELDPHLQDPGGARIDALVERHIPRLLTTHAYAVRAAPRDQRRLDGDLAHGLELARRALEQSMETAADAARCRLLTEIRFLEIRHPDAVRDD